MMQPLTRNQMAWCAAQDIADGAYVNLGLGMPTLVGNYLPDDREIILQSENGIVGIGSHITKSSFDSSPCSH